MGKQADGALDYFDAAPVGNGIAVRMSRNVSLILSQLVDELIRFLENDELELQNRGTDRWAFASAVLLRHLFPDAYRDNAAVRAFRERHAAALRDSAAPRRVHARCADGTEFVISHTEVDDWLTTLGLARSVACRALRETPARPALGSPTCRSASLPRSTHSWRRTRRTGNSTGSKIPAGTCSRKPVHDYWHSWAATT
jgi:hypothetical protein